MRTSITPAPQVDWFQAGPDEIKAEIARTRAHMDALLSQLGRKFKPRLNLSRLQVPLAALFLAVSGIVVFRAIRRRSKPKAWTDRFGERIGRIQNSAKAKRPEVRSAGILDQVRALRLAASAARSGKPAIYIVEPRRI
ncbi:MAG TPA: DUF3618 domain-containing protein [Fibrobacteria bacterium]|nr:DUF3618 domain-containing protein [Fibrobacteria bacterium]